MMDLGKLKDLILEIADHHNLMEEGFCALKAINNSQLEDSKAYGFTICHMNTIFLEALDLVQELFDMVQAADSKSTREHSGTGKKESHMELNEKETCAILRAQMRETMPDIVRTLCVTDALGNQMTPWFLLQDGLSRETAQKLLEEKLSLLGEPVQEVENLKNGILTVAETSVRLRALGMKVSPTTLRLGLQQRVFPFGDCVKTGEDNTLCFVYEKLLNQWIQARFNPDEAEESVVLPEKSGVAVNALPASIAAS